MKIMNLGILMLVIALFALPYYAIAQSTNVTHPTLPNDTSSLNPYEVINIIGIIVIILLIAFSYASQKKMSEMLKIQNERQKQEIGMLKKEYTIIMKEGAKLQQMSELQRKEFGMIMKENLKLQQIQVMMKKKPK